MRSLQRSRGGVLVAIAWLYLLEGGSTSTARAFAYPTAASNARLDHHRAQFVAAPTSSQQQLLKLVSLRGGQKESHPSAPEDDVAADTPSLSAKEGEEAPATPDSKPQATRHLAFSAPSASLLASAAKSYSGMLERSPILTKSATAGITFFLSDYLAQRIERRGNSGSGNGNGGSRTFTQQQQRSLNWSRLLSATAIGFFYFGPAAHYWYEMIFRMLPGTTLASTMQKAALGQIFFGPAFTCIFFASSLLQAGKFSLPNWFRKIKVDLPGAWLAGIGFWPLVDFVSYGFIPVNYIPLFVNIMSLIWTVYLSLVANR